MGSYRHEGGGENLSYPVDKAADRADNNNKNTSCCGLRSSLAVPEITICHSARSECDERSRGTHSSLPHSTANAAPHTYVSATQALDQLERKLDQRLRVAATNFTNTAAQGFVQQSLPQMLLGGHWLTEKFQFLSTLAWQTGDDEGGILGELDIVVPLYGTRDTSETDQSSWFLQPGLVSWEADNGDRRLDVNIGLAYRQLIQERIAVGAAVFYDHNIDSDLSRIGAGADMVSPYTYLAVNYYHPINSWRTGERLGYEERALRGVDVNVAQALWDSHWVLEASGGYWKGYDADNRKGEWQPAGSVGIRYYPLDYLSVYADYAYHHDNVDTDRFAAGVEFSYPGKQQGIGENAVDVWRPATREKRILYAERKKRMIPVNADASTGTPTLTLATAPADTAGGGTISLLVTSNIAVAGILTLPLMISGQVAAADFTNGLIQSVSANFNGGTTATVMIATVKDTDAIESYTIMLGSGTGYSVGSDSTATGRITIALPILTLATDPAAVAAGNAISLMITSDEAIAGTSTLSLTISDRGSSGLVVGDFTAGLTQSVSANFAGTTSATVTIATTRFGGSAKSYTITLGSGADYTVGSDGTANGTINAVTPTLTLVTPPTAVTAGNDISVVVTSDIPVAGSLTVGFLIDEVGGITTGDFTTSLTSLARVFLAGSESINFNGGRTATITIETARDGDTAPETYTIGIRLSADGSYLTGISRVSGMINP